MITLITSDQTSPCIDGSLGPPFHVVIGFRCDCGHEWDHVPTVKEQSDDSLTCPGCGYTDDPTYPPVTHGGLTLWPMLSE